MSSWGIMEGKERSVVEAVETVKCVNGANKCRVLRLSPSTESTHARCMVVGNSPMLSWGPKAEVCSCALASTL